MRRATSVALPGLRLHLDFYPRSPCGERHFPAALRWKLCYFYPRSPCGERHIKPTSVLTLVQFLSTLSLRRATDGHASHVPFCQISIHALLAESDACMLRTGVLFSLFLSTLSLRRATDQFDVAMSGVDISIHALLAESDCSSDSFNVYFSIISIHALLAESDVVAVVVILSTGKFLSTLSLRRATGNPARRPIGRRHFYPRSPCGERRCQADKICKPVVISIHALLAESDRPLSALYSVNRYFYPRSPCGERQTVFVSTTGFSLFLSTLSLRRATCCRLGHTWPSAYFYPRSPCGERLPETAEVVPSRQFLSTLSLRRATVLTMFCNTAYSSFLSTLSLRRATCARGPLRAKGPKFLSTLSLRRATPRPEKSGRGRPIFLSTLSLRRATCCPAITPAGIIYFYPRSPCGERLILEATKVENQYFYPRSPCGERPMILVLVCAIIAFLSTLSLRRATA